MDPPPISLLLFVASTVTSTLQMVLRSSKYVLKKKSQAKFHPSLQKLSAVFKYKPSHVIQLIIKYKPNAQNFSQFLKKI